MSKRSETRTIKVEDEIIVCDFCGGGIGVSQFWSDLSPKNLDTHMDCVQKILQVMYETPEIFTALKKKVKE